MTTIAKVMLPSHMRPELAHNLAHLLVGTAEETPQVIFLSLCMLYASWNVSEEAEFEDYVFFLSDYALANQGDVVGLMSIPEFYAERALNKNGVSSADLSATHEAVTLWSGFLRENETINTEHLKWAVGSLLTNILEADAAETDPLASDMAGMADYFTSLMFNQEEGQDMADKKEVTVVQMGDTQQVFESREAAMRFIMSLAARAGTGGTPGAQPAAPAVPVVKHDPTKPSLRIFNQGDVVSLLQRMPPTTMPGEGNAQQRKLLEAMVNDEGVRNLTETPATDPIAELYDRFPHFEEVLDFITDSLALAACGDEGSPVRIPPILLRGLPGTGKTYFAQELARVLGTHFVERDMSVTSEAWVLSGMDASWKNSKQGVVFDALVHGQTANPVICLNEVDKCSNRGSHNSPISAMYALLEPTSATHFVDEFAPIALDASRVIWVLTANDGEIPDPVMSRLEVFEIPEPTREQSRAIAVSVWESVCRTVLPKGHGFAAELGDSVLDAISAMSPRVMRKVLTRAASSAVMKGRKYLLLEDLESSRKRYQTKVESKPIGFVHSA